MCAPQIAEFPHEPSESRGPGRWWLLIIWAALLTGSAIVAAQADWPLDGRRAWLVGIALAGVATLVGIVTMRPWPAPLVVWQHADRMPQQASPMIPDMAATITQVASLVEVVQANADLVASQHATLGAMQTTRAALARSSSYDPVTGTATHAAFMARLLADVELAQQHDRPLALAIFDIDDFGAINARHGYPFGDEVLFAVAECLRSLLAEGDLLGRLSADRFALLRAGQPWQEMQSLVEGILGRVAHEPLVIPDPATTQPHPVRVTLRAGLALYPDDGTTARALLANAEGALGHHRNLLRDEATPRGHTISHFDVRNRPEWDHPLSESLAPLDPLPPAYPPSYIDVMTQKYSSIHALTSALEAHDAEAVLHARHLAELAQETALIMGRSPEEGRLVGLAALLHDVGNLGIPADILRKAEPLSAEEWAFVREHPHLGERLLTSVGGVLAAIAPIVAAHRERWDGTGYPAQARGEAIPLGARIVAVCDVYDALISARPYRAPFAHEAAIAELQRNAGTQFDPAVVQAFITACRSQPV